MKIKALLYCTKAKPYLIQGLAKPMHTLDANNPFNFNWQLVKKGFSNDRLNGKIVAECDYEVEEMIKFYCCGNIIQTKTMIYEALLGRSCLTDEEFKEYNPNYAIHIKNLHIFDKPKELSECYTKKCQYGKCSTCEHRKKEIPCSTIDTPITKAPQNMMRVWLYENGEWVMYILISIQSQWMCKILNGEKTIEVRKKVLKEMLKNE